MKLGQEPTYPFELIMERVGGAVIRWENYKGINNLRKLFWFK